MLESLMNFGKINLMKTREKVNGQFYINNFYVWKYTSEFAVISNKCDEINMKKGIFANHLWTRQNTISELPALWLWR